MMPYTVKQISLTAPDVTICEPDGTITTLPGGPMPPSWVVVREDGSIAYSPREYDPDPRIACIDFCRTSGTKVHETE
jgi:hypothetical protein